MIDALITWFIVPSITVIIMYYTARAMNDFYNHIQNKDYVSAVVAFIASVGGCVISIITVCIYFNLLTT